MRVRNWSAQVLALAALAAPAAANVKLPRLFSDHMVLPAGVPVPVWGWAEPGEAVEVRAREVTASGRADERGRWRVTLQPLAAGGPFEVAVRGRNTLRLVDVLAGEVWLGSGQSNLTMPMERTAGFPAEKAAARHPTLRMFHVGGTTSPTPQEDCSGTWEVCTPETVGAFSGLLYHFGRELGAALGTPVGIVRAGAGGTGIELWIDPQKQQAAPELQPFLTRLREQSAAFDPPAAQAAYEEDLKRWARGAQEAAASGQPAPRRPNDPQLLHARNSSPGGLYHALIAPLVPFAFRGVIWSQGEANTDPGKAPFYEAQLRLLVRDWRAKWQSDLPFVWVQLAGVPANRTDWPAIREAMRRALDEPRTGLASAVDLGGEPLDVHYKNKKEIGHRLALWALGRVYGRGNETSGPLPVACRTDADQVVVAWSHAAGLTARGGAPAGFEVAAEDSRWRSVPARIVGETVVLSPGQNARPTQVRYAWANNPAVNLYNRAGLPASPFRLEIAP